MSQYRALTWTPPLAEQGLALARRLDFSHSCTPAVGRLLHVLAAQVVDGPIGEIGTGCGVGAGWIATGKRPAVPFYTIELDESRATESARLLAGAPGVTMLQGDWREILAHGPFALLFADGGKAKESAAETLLAALQIGGLLVLDDFTPEEYWPAEWQGRPDSAREFWLNDPRLAATEVRVTERSSVILATRIA